MNGDVDMKIVTICLLLGLLVCSELTAKDKFVPNKAKVESLLNGFIKVDGGTFNMGSPIDPEPWITDEKLHSVTLDSYYMQENEVTQELWVAVMGKNPTDHKHRNNFPATNMSWNDCQEFIKKINKITGREYRLPTEAEWEYAARGGNKSKGYIYSGSDNIYEVAWIWEAKFHLHVVKGKKTNELGLYDMSGNVWEWCSDWLADYRLDEKGRLNPKGPDSGGERVLRGGSFYDSAIYSSSAYRLSCKPYYGDDNYGFRLARTK